ncbi:hypothetical protein C2G38_2189092 [Gigaspora rosea]|uniref:Uncharacterized protein n=1 Tax=Gigaspora rosea TaxID=44941 RepID=A0A397V487_9GLOM|nr:hypothetical protein C2G38_2189092 [Gigaspora rosea]
MSWTLGSLQSFIILREIKNKKKQNKQNETSESESDRESETSTSSSSSSSSAPSLTSLSFSSSLLSASLKIKKTIEYLDSESYERIKEKVFIWCDSALKDIYYIDEKLTWVDQKNDIITKLLPALCKKVNKKYNVSQQELLKMLYGRWRACHREFNIRKQGDEQVERNRRRKAKNSMDPHIMKYPQSDLVAILKDSGYHSEEWEETDSEDDNYQKKHLYTFIIIPALKRLRITSQKYIQQTCFPPFGAPTLCLTNEALKKLNFPIEHIPIYDSEESNEGNDNNEDNDNNDSDDNSDTSKNTKKKNGKEKESKKRSNKKKEKKKKLKKHRK